MKKPWVLMVWAVVVPGAWAELTPTSVGCASSAEAAVARMVGGLGVADKADGFKVVAVRIDPLRKRRWAMVASCVDAARPMVAIELDDASGAFEKPVAAEKQVRTGDRVQVVREGDDSRMELAGWAEDSGGSQDLIRVRLPKFSADGAEAPPVIRCRVVGVDVVEVIR